MRKKLPFDLYRLAFLGVRKLAIFHKDNDFLCCHGDEHWHELWRSVFALLGFIGRQEDIKTNNNVMVVAAELIELFNLFIASGHRIFSEVRKKEEPEKGEEGHAEEAKKEKEEARESDTKKEKEKEQEEETFETVVLESTPEAKSKLNSAKEKGREQGNKEEKEKEKGLQSGAEQGENENRLVVWNPGSALFYYKMIHDSKIIQAFAELGNFQSLSYSLSLSLSLILTSLLF